jgi:lysophospholipase L1-like esterase
MKNQLMRLFLVYAFLPLLASACVSVAKTSDQFYSSKGFYPKMIERSLLNLGNTYRLKQAISKARQGENVTIAYIGGSITQGYGDTPEDAYVNGSFENFKKLFGANEGTNVNYVNAGMAGTPSTVGMIRYERDVLAKSKTPPDIVIVEFAVNDADDPTNGAAYESLVKTILESGNRPAVILLFSVFKSHWNLQDRFIELGEKYQLPMISVKNAVVPELDKEVIAEDEFFRDNYHPTAYGFKIMADCLTNYFIKADESPVGEDLVIPPTPVIGTQFTGIRMIDASAKNAGITIVPGSFSAKDKTISYFGAGDMSYPTFPENWFKSNSPENKPFKMTLSCKNLVLVYKISGDSSFGEAEFLVDGKVVDSAYGNTQGAWNNPWTIVLIDDSSAAKHTVEIRMAKGDEAKNFTILAFGYTQ